MTIFIVRCKIAASDELTDIAKKRVRRELGIILNSSTRDIEAREDAKKMNPFAGLFIPNTNPISLTLATTEFK